MLITVEGIDASGKSTQVAILAEALGGHVYKFPRYETPVGRIIHQMLAGTLSVNPVLFAERDQATALVLQALMITNRLESLPDMENLVKTGPVIVDRYNFSGMAYGAVDGLSMSWLIDIHKTLPAPDLAILLDISAQESFTRRPVRTDAYESNRERLGRVVHKYREIWSTFPEKYPEQFGETAFVTIDGTLEQDRITREILMLVDKYR